MSHAKLHTFADKYGVLVGFDRLVRRELRGVWVRGSVPAGGSVWITNHHSWWDVFATIAVLRREHDGRPGVLMDADNLAALSFLRRAGALGTNELRESVARVQAGYVLIVFPEGDLRPAGPLGPVRPGADWIARRAGAPVVVAATRVVLRGRQAPEAYLDIEPPAGASAGAVDSGTTDAGGADAGGGDPGAVRAATAGHKFPRLSCGSRSAGCPGIPPTCSKKKPQTASIRFRNLARSASVRT